MGPCIHLSCLRTQCDFLIVSPLTYLQKSKKTEIKRTILFFAPQRPKSGFVYFELDYKIFPEKVKRKC